MTEARKLEEALDPLSRFERGELAKEWALFRRHRPVGGYLPVGQLDGDCKECGVEWPCLPIALMLKEVFPC